MLVTSIMDDVLNGRNTQVGVDHCIGNIPWGVHNSSPSEYSERVFVEQQKVLRLLFHGDNGCVKAPLCNVISKLRILLLTVAVVGHCCIS